jgi:hypothetical protein
MTGPTGFSSQGWNGYDTQPLMSMSVPVAIAGGLAAS